MYAHGRIATVALLFGLAVPLPAQAQPGEPSSPEAPASLQPQGQTCSVPPFTEQHVVAGSATWTVDAEGCGLDAALNAGVSSAAVAHYARRPDLGNFRMRFRVDLSELATLNAVQAVQLAAGVAGASAPPGAEATALLFQIGAFGNIQGTQKRLVVSAACAGQPGNRCSAASTLATERPTIGLDWISGPAASGHLRWWIDTDFDQAPTGVLAVDNLAWGALERVVLGLSSPSTSFVANQGARTVRFDRIEVLEDQLAWQDFESLDGGACTLDALPPLVIGAGGGTISGNTCGGTHSLTTLASGSTSSPTPERNYRVQITGVGFEQSPRPLTMTTSDPNFAAFLCERACSPSARCHLVSSAGPAAGTFEPGEYRLVVKALGGPSGQCGGWTVNVASVLK
jgi:hypothetical protein